MVYLPVTGAFVVQVAAVAVACITAGMMIAYMDRKKLGYKLADIIFIIAIVVTNICWIFR